jgi:two-component system cell cycle sensor histidine kinase/response regulator CckA
VGSAIDITDVKRSLEQAFARQKLETLGVLASVIAHDFNNILGGIMAQAELAIADLSPGAPCKPELKMISELVVRGSDTVRELMIYAGKETDGLDDVDVSAILNGMLPLLRS